MNDVDLLEQQAVEKAIDFNWEEAIKLNEKIIDLDKENLAAYLRLGFAYFQLNLFEKAKKYYSKALKIQPNNTVAKENFERIKVLEIKGAKKGKKPKFSLNADMFFEIPGKTKSISLVNLGQKNILAQLIIGEEVFIKPKKRKIEIRTKDGDYIGSLPDDLSKRLLLFLKAKSEYLAYIKEAGLNRMVIFIKEEKKSKKVNRFISFPLNSQMKVSQLQEETENRDDDDSEEGDVIDNDLEKLAEKLENEEKVYLPYGHEEDEETEE